MLQLYVTRSKIFIALDESGTERRFTLGRSTTPQAAPDWVRDTATFKYGVKDKSIVDLTPPKPVAAVVADEPEVEDSDNGGEDETGAVDETGDSTGDTPPAQAPSTKKAHKGGKAATLGLK